MWLIPILIPVLAAFVILVSPKWNVVKQPGDFNSGWSLRENRKRFGIFLLVSFILTGLVAGGLYWGGTAKMWYKEVWNNKVLRMKHEEKWTTHETRTETYTTGSGKNQQTHTRIVHYTEDHGPYWTLYDDQGKRHRTNEGVYRKWVGIWGNEKKTGENKGSAAGFDRAITGGIFESHWPKTFETIHPRASIHKYKNKVRQAPSVLNLGEPTEELVKRYPRPADQNNTSPIIYLGGVLPDADDLLLRRVNAKLGRQCEIHTILVVFPKDAPRSVMDDVLVAWQGPNKNELATFLSIDGRTVKWCEVHSWLDNTTIHGIVRDAMMGEPFSCQRYADMLLENVPRHWHRKEFVDFDYLKVNIHWGWIVSALVLSIIIVFLVYFGLDGGFERVADRRRERRWQRFQNRRNW